MPAVVKPAWEPTPETGASCLSKLVPADRHRRMIDQLPPYPGQVGRPNWRGSPATCRDAAGGRLQDGCRALAAIEGRLLACGCQSRAQCGIKVIRAIGLQQQLHPWHV